MEKKISSKFEGWFELWDIKDSGVYFKKWPRCDDKGKKSWVIGGRKSRRSHDDVQTYSSLVGASFMNIKLLIPENWATMVFTVRAATVMDSLMSPTTSARYIFMVTDAMVDMLAHMGDCLRQQIHQCINPDIHPFPSFWIFNPLIIFYVLREDLIQGLISQTI